MKPHHRLVLALFILLSGFALLPQATLVAGPVNWQRFVGGNEDTVSVTRARWLDGAAQGGRLEVHAATTAGAGATLSVFRTTDNHFIGYLKWSGRDHSGVFTQPVNPRLISVAIISPEQRRR